MATVPAPSMAREYPPLQGGRRLFLTAAIATAAFMEILFGQIATPRFFQGMGLAFFFLPLNQIVLSGIPSRDLASASGVSNFIRTMSGSISTAVTVWVWNRRTDYHHAVLTEHIRNSAAGWTDYQAQLSARGFGGEGALQYVDQVIGGQAATLAVNDVFFALGCAFVLLVPFVWLAKPPFGARGSGAAKDVEGGAVAGAAGRAGDRKRGRGNQPGGGGLLERDGAAVRH